MLIEKFAEVGLDIDGTTDLNKALDGGEVAREPEPAPSSDENEDPTCELTFLQRWSGGV